MDLDTVVNGLAHELWAMAQGRAPAEDVVTPMMAEILSFADAVRGAERERCEQAVRDEPELPGEMPQAMFDTVQHDKDACAEALRILVRLTKQGILERIAKRPNV
tara:strand:+ start:155 stop:469 length:315 start_codon:yes stop_codon:yes gene_type:complete